MKKPSIKMTKIESETLGNVELRTFKNNQHHYPKHYHERLGIVVVEGGESKYFYTGGSEQVGQGNIIVNMPGEVHAGAPVTPEGLSYRIFSFDPEWIEKVATNLTGRSMEGLYFPRIGLNDPKLAKELFALHQQLECSEVDLKNQSLTINAVEQLILRYAKPDITQTQEIKIPAGLQKVRDYIEAHYDENIQIEELCAIAGVNESYLIRAFSKKFGIPPHAFLLQVRLHRAKEHLSKGMPPADVAIDTGFFDQSHMYRHFKRIWGITPGQYQQAAVAA